MKGVSKIAVNQTARAGSGSPENGASGLAWYCARTKLKHEHIAAANLRSHLRLDVFHPQLRNQRSTGRGIVRVIEPLFPCYIFVRCVLSESLTAIRYTNGVGSFVSFGNRIPIVPNPVIEELRVSFGIEELIDCEESLSPGASVIFTAGAFAGMNASVLRVLSAGQRVQVLLDVLGRPTSVDVARSSLVLENFTIADRLPSLAARVGLV